MKRNHSIAYWKLIMLAGLAGGLVEMLWITAYSSATTVDGARVALEVTASFWPAAMEWVYAPALGVIIHLVLSIMLAAMLIPLLSRIPVKYAGAGFMISSAMLLLAMVWVANFHIILPLVNPAFVTLIPLGVTLISKLLFGVALGLVLCSAPHRTRHPSRIDASSRLRTI